MYQRRSSMVRHFQNPQLFHQEWLYRIHASFCLYDIWHSSHPLLFYIECKRIGASYEVLLRVCYHSILSLPLYTQSIGCLPKLLADCTIEIGEAVFFADLTILRLFVIFAYL